MVTIMEDRLVIFKFSSAEARDWVLANGLWRLGGKPIMMWCRAPD